MKSILTNIIGNFHSKSDFEKLTIARLHINKLLKDNEALHEEVDKLHRKNSGLINRIKHLCKTSKPERKKLTKTELWQITHQETVNSNRKLKKRIRELEKIDRHKINKDDLTSIINILNHD